MLSRSCATHGTSYFMEGITMQDYAKMYRREYEKRDPQEVLYQIRKAIRSGLKPTTMLLAIIILVETASKR